MRVIRTIGKHLRDIDLFFPGLLERAWLRLSPAPLRGDKILLPLVVIVGPPRVGSTLMSQLLASQYQFFFFDNFQHAFLRYPYLAFRFSRRFVPKRAMKFDSDHGFEDGFGGLSEGIFFWEFWFDMPVTQKPPEPTESRLQHVQRVLNQIYLMTQKPMLNASGTLSFYLTELDRRFEKLVIINMRRDPVANALSLLRARRLVYSNQNKWWSIRPALCVSLEEDDPYTQVACQVVETYREIQRQRATIPRAAFIDVQYEDLCSSPTVTLERIQHACSGASIELTTQPERPPIRDLLARGPRPNDLEDAERFRKMFAEVDWDELWSSC